MAADLTLPTGITLAHEGASIWSATCGDATLTAVEIRGLVTWRFLELHGAGASILVQGRTWDEAWHRLSERARYRQAVALAAFACVAGRWA